MKLQNYNQNGLELVINTETGEAFASARAVARMMTTSEKLIQATQIIRYAESAFKGVTNTLAFSAEIQTAGGVQAVTLYNETSIREFAKKYNPELLDKFADAGIRIYLHKLAGYQVTSSAIAPKELTRLEILEMAIEAEKKAIALQAKIDADADKVLFAETVSNVDNLMTLSDFFRSASIGRTTGFRMLRELDIIMKSSPLPYQRYVDNGYFKVKIKVTELPNGSRQDGVALVTPKGELWLSKKLLEYHNREAVTVQLEKEVKLI